MRKHYVEFFSPGTFVSESSSRPIDAWDIPAAIEMANGIQERHGAKPYGFQFHTQIEVDPVDDGEGGSLKVTPRTVEKSGMHWLGGTLQRFNQVPDTPENATLRSNMQCNEYPVVIVNTNSFKTTMPFGEGDCIVDASGLITKRGSEADLMEYRQQFKEWRAAYYAKQLQATPAL